VSVRDRMTSISVPLLLPLSESLFPPDAKFGSVPEGQILLSQIKTQLSNEAYGAWPFWGFP